MLERWDLEVQVGVTSCGLSVFAGVRSLSGLVNRLEAQRHEKGLEKSGHNTCIYRVGV